MTEHIIGTGWGFRLLVPEQLGAAYEGICPFCYPASLRFEDDPALSAEENRTLHVGEDDEPQLVHCACCGGMFGLAKGRAEADIEFVSDWRDGYVEPPCEHSDLITFTNCSQEAVRG